MSNASLVYPMAAMVLYVWLLALFNFATRVAAVRSRRLPIGYFRAFTAGEPDERLIVVGRHYDNQFQLPVVFLITAATEIALGHVDRLSLICAWSFFASRLVHAWVHLGKNQPLRRAAIFGLGWAVLLIQWGDLLIQIQS